MAAWLCSWSLFCLDTIIGVVCLLSNALFCVPHTGSSSYQRSNYTGCVLSHEPDSRDGAMVLAVVHARAGASGSHRARVSCQEWW